MAEKKLTLKKRLRSVWRKVFPTRKQKYVRETVEMTKEKEKKRGKPAHGLRGYLAGYVGDVASYENHPKEARKYYKHAQKEYEQAGMDKQADDMFWKSSDATNRSVDQTIKKTQDLFDELGLGKIVAFIFVLVGLFFLSSNFTGYAIFNLSQNNLNISGVVFFVVGLIIVFILKKKS